MEETESETDSITRKYNEPTALLITGAPVALWADSLHRKLDTGDSVKSELFKFFK
jgi:hypothetical protein